MQVKLFFKIILGIIFLIGSQRLQAQNCEDVEIEVKVEGTACESGGTPITINVKGPNLDLSECYFVITTLPNDGNYITLQMGEKTKLDPGHTYNVRTVNLKCNGESYIPKMKEFKIEQTTSKAEYKRCSASDIFVSATVSGGKGPYTYQLIADGQDVASGTGTVAGNEISFSASTSSSNLELKITDAGCTQNKPVTVNLKKTADYSAVLSVIEGDKAACINKPIKLSVKSEYSGSGFEWKKGDIVVSRTRTLEMAEVTEDDKGMYTFSMKFDGCETPFSEDFTIEVDNHLAPTVKSPAYFCLNSKEESLSDYASATSDSYTLVWYKPDAPSVGIPAPMFNPNLSGTTKYLVSQKNAAGCESPKAELTIIVENPPAKIDNNVIICLSDDSKPVIRVVNAGSNIYNLYKEYKGGAKIGSGKGNNDTAIIETSQNLVAGDTYYLETENEHGCVSEGRATVPIAIKASLIIGPEKICFGETLTLSVNYAGGKIVWTKPNKSYFEGKNLEINKMTFDSAGTYSLRIEDSGLGCVMRDEIRVKVAQPAPPDVTENQLRYYQGEKASALTAIPKAGLKLKWYGPGENTPPTGQSPVPATDKEGVFIYQVSQDSLGCESPTVQIKVIVGTIPSSVSTSDINICIANKPVIQINNTVKDYKYTVSYKEKVIAEEKGNGSTISLTSGVSISENAELEIIITDIYNAHSLPVKMNLISVNNLIDLKNSSSSICDGSNGQLIAVNITNATYTWTKPNGNTANGESVAIPNASKTDEGTYILAVTTQGCPVATWPVDLKVEKPAKPSTVKEIYYCTGDNASQLTATALSGYKTVWFDESQTEIPDAPTPNTSNANTLVYYVSQVSISDTNCSSDKEKISITVENKPDSMVLETVNVCYASGNTKPVSVRIPTSTKEYIYSLYSMEKGGSPVGQAASAGDNSPVDITINDSEIQSDKVYYLEITNKAGCASTRTPVKVILTEITLSPNELPPYQVEEFYLQRMETNVPEAKYSIVQGYLPIGFTLSSLGDISGIASSYADPATFTVEVTSNLGCSIQKEYVLKSELLVAKMFSPNGDGINDVFMKGYKVVIFDRIGRKLHSGDDGWDGTFNGRIMPEDVYYYILYYKDKEGKEQRVISYVTVIKTL